MKMIVAMDLNNGIGKNNKLPWHYPADLHYFKCQTEGATVVMGANTWNSLPNTGLPNRECIVLTKTTTLISEPNKIISNISEIPIDSWIIGGKQLYESTINLVDEVHITKIPYSHQCDVFLDLDLTNFSFYKRIHLDGVIIVEVFKRSLDA